MGPKRCSWILVLFALLSLAKTTKADLLTDTVTVDGSYAFASNGYGIPPHGGTLNGQSQSFFCMDFSTEIRGGESWQVTITSLTGSNLSLTKLGNQTTYLEMAWLITQMMGTTDQLQKAMDQYAVWSFTGGPNPYGSNATLVAAALAAVQGGFARQGWEILTPTGSAGQEFLVFVPEPAESLMPLIGLAMIAMASRKRRGSQASAAYVT